jgi:dienelactone hydrolase
MHRKLLSALLLAICTVGLAASAQQPGIKYRPPAEVKAAFLQMLDRPKVDADWKVALKSTEGEIKIWSGDFASEKKPDGTLERVPVLIVKPANLKGKAAAVICLHAAGGNKEGQLDLLTELAKRGIVGVAIDERYHGARSGGVKGSKAYVAAIMRAWQAKPGQPMEHPLYYDNCWDLWRTVDVLEKLDFVDGNRIGVIGFSMGGIQTVLAGAVDERIKVAVPALGVQSFKWNLENDKWQSRATIIDPVHKMAAEDIGEMGMNARSCQALWNKLIPGIVDQFDCPGMVRLFAGRALLMINGDADPNCPIEGARLAFAEAEKAFTAAGCPERLRIMIGLGAANRVTLDQHKAALEWFQRWLK